LIFRTIETVKEKKSKSEEENNLSQKMQLISNIKIDFVINTFFLEEFLLSILS
jgi:hypothetical protein